MKTLLVAAALFFLKNRAWSLLFASGSGAGGGAVGTPGAVAAAGSGSTTGNGGAVYAGGGDYGALADAIAALAAGVRLPNIQSKTVEGAAGSNEIVAGEGGKAVRVLAYAVTTSGANDARFRSGAAITDLWRVDLETPAGKSGANLATSWPGYLFSTNPGDPLNITLDGAAAVSVTYWQETA